MSELDDLMNSIEAAAYLKVTKQRIYQLRDQGKIGRLVGGYWLYSKPELDNYAATKRKKGRPVGTTKKEGQSKKQIEGHADVRASHGHGRDWVNSSAARILPQQRGLVKDLGYASTN